MSLIESLGWSLESMGFAQLALAFAAVIGYSLALNGSLSPHVRGYATLMAIAAATAFSVLAPSWASGMVLMLIGVLAFGAFAACSWLMAALIGLDGARIRIAAEADAATQFAAGRPRPRQAAVSTSPTATGCCD